MIVQPYIRWGAALHPVGYAMKKSTVAIPFGGSQLYLTRLVCAFFNSDKEEGLSGLELQKHLGVNRIEGGSCRG